MAKPLNYTFGARRSSRVSNVCKKPKMFLEFFYVIYQNKILYSDSTTLFCKRFHYIKRPVSNRAIETSEVRLQITFALRTTRKSWLTHENDNMTLSPCISGKPLIYLNSIFAIFQFKISSLTNLFFTLFQTWILQATAGRKIQFKLGKNPVHQTGELQKSSADR